MTIDFENKTASDYNDIEYSWYIRSNYGDYRLTMNFIGALNDDGSINFDITSFCCISLNEVQNNRPEMLQAIKARIEEELSIELESYEESVYNTHPELKSCIYIDDFDNFDNSVKIATTLLKQADVVLQDTSNYTIYENVIQDRLLEMEEICQ